MRKLLLISTFAFLPGCAQWNALTPAQQAQVFCAVAANGAAIAVSVTKGGAATTAAQVQGASVVACNAATQVGQIVTKPAGS